MDVESDTAGASSAFSKHTTRALLTRIWMEWGAGSWQAHILYTFVCLFQTVDLFILSQWAHVKQGKWMSDSESRRMWERAQASKEQGRASVVVWFFSFASIVGPRAFRIVIAAVYWFLLLFRCYDSHCCFDSLCFQPVDQVHGTKITIWHSKQPNEHWQPRENICTRNISTYRQLIHTFHCILMRQQ